MKKLLFIILFISNFVLGQSFKVMLDTNMPKYEIKDEYNRFDDIGSSTNNVEALQLDFSVSSELKITNIYSSGFTGHTIKFSLNKNLELKNVYFHYWTDVQDTKNKITYIVRKANLKLSNNPFSFISGFRGIYILEIEYYVNNIFLKNEIFKGKFKSFVGIDKKSEEYIWTLKQNKLWKGISNENGVYLNPDIYAKLKSKIADVNIALEAYSELKIPEIKAIVIVDENGVIEKETIKFLGIYDEKLKDSITTILVTKMLFYPACVNNKEVKSKIPINIKLK